MGEKNKKEKQGFYLCNMWKCKEPEFSNRRRKYKKEIETLF